MPEVQNQDINWAVLSPKALEKNWFYTFLIEFGNCWQSLASFTLPPPCLYVISTLVIGFRTYPDNSHWSPHLKFLNLITYAKIIFPANVTFIDSRDLMWAYLFGDTTIKQLHMVTNLAIMLKLKGMDSLSPRLIYLLSLLNIWYVNSKDWDWALDIVPALKENNEPNGGKLITYNSFH